MPSIRQIARLMEPICLYSGVHLSPLTTSVEHILPVSKLKTREARLDLHNMYSCDIGINLYRSNYKFVNGTEFDINHKRKTFVPPLLSRGVIARTCLYMQETYNVDVCDVIDLDCYEQWLLLNVSSYEQRHSIFVKHFQNYKINDNFTIII